MQSPWETMEREEPTPTELRSVEMGKDYQQLVAMVQAGEALSNEELQRFQAYQRSMQNMDSQKADR